MPDAPRPDEDRSPAARFAAERLEEARRWDEVGGRVVLGLGVGILATGTVAYHYLEGWSWVDSLYFSTVAVTTVGFGDLTPTSDLGKLFTVFYLLAGIAVIGLYIDQRVSARRARAARRRARRLRDEEGEEGAGS